MDREEGCDMIHVLKDFGPFTLVEAFLHLSVYDEFYAADVMYLEGKGFSLTRPQMGDWVKDLDEMVYRHVVEHIQLIIPMRDN
jgi:hypothetical protein